MDKIFDHETHLYWDIRDFVTKGNVLLIDLVRTDVCYSDVVIKDNKNDKEFIPWIKKIKTDLPIIYRDCINI